MRSRCVVNDSALDKTKILQLGIVFLDQLESHSLKLFTSSKWKLPLSDALFEQRLQPANPFKSALVHSTS